MAIPQVQLCSNRDENIASSSTYRYNRIMSKMLLGSHSWLISFSFFVPLTFPTQLLTRCTDDSTGTVSCIFMLWKCSVYAEAGLWTRTLNSRLRQVKGRGSWDWVKQIQQLRCHVLFPTAVTKRFDFARPGLMDSVVLEVLDVGILSKPCGIEC